MSARADRLVELLPEIGVDAMLITDLVNVRYLTGYTGSNGLAVIGPQTRAFVTDFRYVEQAAAEVDRAFDRRRAPRDLLETVRDVLPSGQLRLGFEEAHLTVRGHQRLRSSLEERVELIAAGAPVERLRAIKEPEEIDALRAAASLANEAFEQVIGQGLVGRTERATAMVLEREMVNRGARRPSFDTIVAAGPHGARPHAESRDVEIRAGDMVVIDWGAVLDGYCSDCTRTLATGEVGDVEREVYELVRAAQQAGLEALTAGADARAVDGTARAVIEAGGYGEQFGHGLGHGVGLDVHEGPRLSQRAEGSLEAGNVVTVEPGIYLAERFGVRIEDLVVVRADGREVLTGFPKELTVTA